MGWVGGVFCPLNLLSCAHVVASASGNRDAREGIMAKKMQQTRTYQVGDHVVPKVHMKSEEQDEEHHEGVTCIHISSALHGFKIAVTTARGIALEGMVH